MPRLTTIEQLRPGEGLHAGSVPASAAGHALCLHIGVACLPFMGMSGERFLSVSHTHWYGDSISEYKFKRGFKPEGERIRNVMEEIFQVAPQENGGKLTINYGAIKELKAWVEDKKLFVETQSDRTITDAKVIMDTNKRFRDFLEEATGYTAKERLKQAKKDVQGSEA